MSSAIIRIANKKDIQKISLLWIEMVKELMPESNYNVEWWRKRADILLGMEEYFIYVAEIDGLIVGYIDFMIFPEPATSTLNGIGQTFYVLSKYRGNGISGKLWKVAIDKLKKNYVENMEILCADKQRPFWEKRGFKFEYNYMKKKGV